MEFEFDANKSNSNKEKHGINFVEAQQLWKDEDRVRIRANTEGKPRFLVVGKIINKHWSAVITYREDKIRIISVRRARKKRDSTL